MATTTSHYSRYDDGLDTDEEEEERRLSEQHGEAADDDGNNGAPKRKRANAKQQNTKLTEEDAAAAKEFEDKIKRKKARPALTPVELKSAKGLIFVRRSFPTQIKKYRDVPNANKVRGTGARSNKLAQKLNTTSQINAAAQYSRSLMGAYRDFAQELFPFLAVEDVFLKIEDLGSKKEVKDYLQLMRNESRKEYLEGIYGVEKADRIINELEYGMRSVHPVQEKGRGELGDAGAGNVMSRMGRAATSDDEGGDGGETPPASPPVIRAPVANPYASKKADEVVEAPQGIGTEESEENNNETASGDNLTMEKDAGGEEGDDDDEAEATFSVNGDDNMAEDSTTLGADKESESAKPDAVNENYEDKAEESNEKTADNMDTELAEKDNNHIESTGTEPKIQDSAVDAVSEKQKDATEEDGDEDKNGSVETFTKPEDAKEVEGIEDKSTMEDIQEEVEETPTQVVSVAKTQETLTLMESQLDDAEMEYSQDDERFSQVSIMKGVNEEEKPEDDVELPTQVVGTQDDEGAFTQDERFSQFQSQTQDERFSQEASQQEEQEEHTERFSQFTPGNEPIFEETEVAEEVEVNGNSSQLGQTMETQLSMEY